MVLIAPLVGAAVFLSGLATALPTNSYDSSSSSNSNYDSSNSNSNYNSNSNSNSNYNSNSNSNYDSSNNYNNNYDSSSTSSYESTSTSTTSSYNNNYNNNYDSSSTSTVESTSTTTSYNSYTTSYGSGSNYWGGSGYEDCVNQCIAQFGGGSTGGGYYQASSPTASNYDSQGTGATHTVLVAPSKGVFRMVPFATNASVGDTIKFVWGADNHTVTKSSALLPCNKSSEAPVFASGEQNATFVFTQVVNDTQPIYYYCGTPGHCEKGMFGVINPTMAPPGSPSSAGGMMQSMAANDSDLSAYMAYTSNLTSNNAGAAAWGSNIDLSAFPPWAHSLAATNIMFTQGVFAKNPETLLADNSIDLSSADKAPLWMPLDISQPLNDATAAQDASSSDPAQTPAGPATTAPAPSAEPSTKSNGASSVASPRLLVAAAVVVATIFAL